MKQLIKKYASRKFLVSLASTICGILGMMNVADDTIGLIGSMLMIIIPNVIYIITEGSIDKANVKNMLNNIVDVLGDEKAEEDNETHINVNDKET